MVVEGYKETEIGVIPDDWEIVNVGRNTKLMGGYAFKSQDAKEYGTRWLKIANVGINMLKWEQTSYLAEEYQEKYKKFLLKENDIILAMTRPILRMKLKIAKITNKDIPALLNQRVGKFIFDDNVNPEFMFQLFQHIDFVKLLMLKIMGTDPPNVSSEQLESIQILFPPLKEQEKIADILSTADEKIDAVKGQIQKAETLKKGLLQKLLSEGIGHSKFKDSELGKTPESWELVKFRNIFERIMRKNIENNQNALTISAQLGLVNQKEYFTKIVAGKNFSNYFLLHNGEFAYNKSYSTGYPMGVIKRLDKYEKGILSTLYICFKIINNNVDSNYILYYFYAGIFNKELSTIAQEGARNHGLLNVNINDFFSLRIILPPLQEQKQIVDILSTADEKLKVLRAKKEKYEELKKGLLQKLLSGKVRV